MIRPDKISKSRTRRCEDRQRAMSQQNWLSCPKCDGQRNALPRRDRACSFGWPCCQYLPLHTLGQFQKLFVQCGVGGYGLGVRESPGIASCVCYLASRFFEKEHDRSVVMYFATDDYIPVPPACRYVRSIDCHAPINSICNAIFVRPSDEFTNELDGARSQAAWTNTGRAEPLAM